MASGFGLFGLLVINPVLRVLLRLGAIASQRFMRPETRVAIQKWEARSAAAAHEVAVADLAGNFDRRTSPRTA